MFSSFRRFATLQTYGCSRSLPPSTIRLHQTPRWALTPGAALVGGAAGGECEPQPQAALGRKKGICPANGDVNRVQRVLEVEQEYSLEADEVFSFSHSGLFRFGAVSHSVGATEGQLVIVRRSSTWKISLLRRAHPSLGQSFLRGFHSWGGMERRERVYRCMLIHHDIHTIPCRRQRSGKARVGRSAV